VIALLENPLKSALDVICMFQYTFSHHVADVVISIPFANKCPRPALTTAS
jgi:hypothetical protein